MSIRKAYSSIVKKLRKVSSTDFRHTMGSFIYYLGTAFDTARIETTVSGSTPSQKVASVTTVVAEI